MLAAEKPLDLFNETIATIVGVGVGSELGLGESVDIDVLGGTASCDPDLGYTLPLGRYQVRVPVDQYEYPGGEFEPHAILSDRVSLTITD
jgi:hypothetical protein